MKLWSTLLNLLAGSSQSAQAKGSASVDEVDASLDQTFESDASEYARCLVRGGYDTRDKIIESVIAYLELDESRMSDVSQIVNAEIALLKGEQMAWPDITDYDRLQRAIITLEGKGIVTRQNFACCQTCGHAEIGEEIENFESMNRKARGYAFFHQQDTEHVVGGGELAFAYGSASDQYSAVDIAKEISDSMRTAGFNVNWNGEATKRVMVELDWQRRWPYV
jgi:hypothetical protein